MQGDDLEFERMAQGVERRRGAYPADDDELLAVLLRSDAEPHDSHVLLYYGFDLEAAGVEDSDIAPCPFCEPSRFNRPGLMHDDVEGYPVKYVMCYCCGARGPNAARQSWALRDWNRRIERVGQCI
jgi:hypothetical protein